LWGIGGTGRLFADRIKKRKGKEQKRKAELSEGELPGGGEGTDSV
jgi:hypothetical protein